VKEEIYIYMDGQQKIEKKRKKLYSAPVWWTEWERKQTLFDPRISCIRCVCSTIFRKGEGEEKTYGIK
jgi:hypothetical protein